MNIPAAVVINALEIPGIISVGLLLLPISIIKKWLNNPNSFQQSQRARQRLSIPKNWYFFQDS
jgi:hypothetical protein